ncbi:hypothetical protein HMPREF3038_01862 [Akkermansia sp. KLE1797]|nr:hypothetical protein HMPREF3038_01862 [Akkermansia sp. KLE1797]
MQQKQFTSSSISLMIPLKVYSLIVLSASDFDFISGVTLITISLPKKYFSCYFNIY